MNSSPCAKLTTSMIPKINVSPEATSAKIIPVTMPLIVWISSWSNGIDARSSTLYAQVLVNDRVVGAQLGRCRMVPNHALLHNVDVPARVEREWYVLLDEQHRDAVAPKNVDDFPDL